MNDTSPLLSQALSDNAKAGVRRARAEQKLRGPKVAMPGGRIVSASEYLRNLHNTENQATTFADIDEHPEKYLKDPRPGFRYVWFSPKDPFSMARVRSGKYVEIREEELLSDTELPYVPGTLTKAGPTHKGTGGTVEIYDLRLAAVSPRVFADLFSPYREAKAVEKLASDTQQFYEQMESEGAVADFEVEEVKRP